MMMENIARGGVAIAVEHTMKAAIDARKSTEGRMKSPRFTAIVAVTAVALFVGCGNTGRDAQAENKPLAEAAQPAPQRSAQEAQSIPKPPARVPEPGAVSVVARALGSNTLGVRSSDLALKVNPKGAGTFVYVAQTRFGDVERNLLWLVLDGRAYALNGPSKLLTPNLPWPRDAEGSVWKTTGLNQYSATEAIAIVFGGAR